MYFISLGFKLLKENGILSYITTNKFFNTGYGKKVQEYFEYPVSRNIKQYLNDRVNTKFKEIPININSKVNMSGYISPIIVNSDLFGAFVLLEDERVITERDIELVQVISKIVTKQQEV